MRAFEEKRIKAVSKGIAGLHFALVKAAMHRFGITDPRYVFNIDETGFRFRGMTGKSTEQQLAIVIRN